MITLNIVGFLVAMGAPLGFGAWVAVRVQRECIGSDERVRRFLRDERVNDAAEDGWTL